jgi:hypothetical protein
MKPEPGIKPMSCAFCGAPLQQKRRGRPRKWCDKWKCKRAGRAQELHEELEQRKFNMYRNLVRDRWPKLDVDVRAQLELIYKSHGLAPAFMATEAVGTALARRDQARHDALFKTSASLLEKINLI